METRTMKWIGLALVAAVLFTIAPAAQAAIALPDPGVVGDYRVIFVTSTKPAADATVTMPEVNAFVAGVADGSGLSTAAGNPGWFAVGATSRSYYEELLTAGVKIYEYQLGILHTKSMTLDGQITLIGSANMDRRSFDLNYENNILLLDPAVTAEMRVRQAHYIEDSRSITLDEVQSWSWRRRIWNNSLAIVGPVL